jgi:hypothetical protein
VSGQNISGPIERFGSICITVLKGNYRNSWILLFDGFLKALFALIR